MAEHWDWVVWTVLALIALVVLERLRTPSTFFFDEWNFVLGRRANTLDSFLQPHNGHLSVLPVFAYRVGFAIFGLGHYRPFRVGGLLVHITVATLVFRYCSVRVGRTVGISAGAVILFLGAGWQNIFWPFQIGFMGSMAAGILAWRLIDRAGRNSRVCAACALGIALACSGLGIAVVVGTAARLAVGRRWSHLLQIIGPPTLLYALWYVSYGQSEGSIGNLRLVPKFVLNEAASSVAALGGRDLGEGRLASVMLVVLVAGTLAWRRRAVSAAIVAPAACALSNWGLIAYSRAQFGDFAASRYVYVGAVLVLLCLVDALGQPSVRSIAWLAPLVAALLIWGNWTILHDGADSIRSVTDVTRVELRAVEWARSSVAPSYQPDGSRMPQLTAGPYLSAIASLSSAGATDGEVAVSPEATRAEADRVSIQALSITLAAAVSSDGMPGTAVGDGRRVSIAPGTCLTVTMPAAATERKVEISVTTGSKLAFTSAGQPIDVRLRRYADLLPNVPNATLQPASSASLSIPYDTAPIQSWIIDIRSTDDMVACNVTS